jgi:uncharacterized protein
MWIYRTHQIAVALDAQTHATTIALESLGLNSQQISDIKVLRYSLDSRNRRPRWVYSFELVCKQPINHPKLQLYTPPEEPEEDFALLPQKILVVGAGPAGMWAAKSLALKGYSVELVEQGRVVEERYRDIRHFLKGRKFNAHSNVLFGEGGAGAFSDGKLTSRTQNKYTHSVLADLVSWGAPTELLYYTKPHVGTDQLQFLVKAQRRCLMDLGVQLRYETVLEDLEVVDGHLKAVCLNGKWEPCECLVLACGHSARPLYRLLAKAGVAMEPKPFALGVRVEHPQTLVNAAQYGQTTKNLQAGTAEYVLKAPACATVPGAYSFCMCPGGVVVPCASEPDAFATNGMSYSRRNGPFANSGIVVPVSPPADSGLFWAMDLQMLYERKAFEWGGKDFSAPGQRVASYLEAKRDADLPKSTFSTGLVPAALHQFFNKAISRSLKHSFVHFERTLPGFIEHGVLIAPETRTSSPLRLVRRPEDLRSVNTGGLYLLGEGAGYSGGIVSSAADGVRMGAIARKVK